jgi:hypothetical protein
LRQGWSDTQGWSVFRGSIFAKIVVRAVQVVPFASVI